MHSHQFTVDVLCVLHTFNKIYFVVDFFSAHVFSLTVSQFSGHEKVSLLCNAREEKNCTERETEKETQREMEWVKSIETKSLGVKCVLPKKANF